MKNENLNVNIIYPDGSHKYLINKKFNDILDQMSVPAPDKILVRGLPGSGKSTLAAKIAYVEEHFHVAADMYHVFDGEYRFNYKNLFDAHQWCYACYRIFPRVIVSNTFVDLKSFQVQNSSDNDTSNHYVFGHKFKPMIITCLNEFENIHGVPEKTLKSMSDRFVSPEVLVEKFYE